MVFSESFFKCLIFIKRFCVKWQTNFLEQFSVFDHFSGLFLGELTKLFVQNTTFKEILQTIAFLLATYEGN
jgi:hypothetical protein